MKRMKYIFASLAVMFACVSCNFLETTPKDEYLPENFYKTADDVEQALMGVYCSLANQNLYGGNLIGRMGLCADIGYEDYANDEGTVGYNSVVPQDVMINNYWRTCYAGIGNANKLLENIDGADLTDQQRTRTVGEAMFLRAYLYFMLTKRFGDVPLIVNTPKSCSLEELQVARTPQKEVYDWILDQMAQAAEMVPSASTMGGGGRVSSSAVYGIMARVALNAAGAPVYDSSKYALARQSAKKVIDMDFHRLNPDYRQVFKNYMQKKYDIKESIWEVEFYGNNIGTYSNTAGQVGRNNGIKVTTSSPFADSIGVSIGAVRANPYFFEMFEEGDSVRRDWTIARYVYRNVTAADGTVTTSRDPEDGKKWDNFCGKFRREEEILFPKSQTYTNTNFPLLRYSDVLLMCAEAIVCDPSSEGSDISKAYEYVNQVRRRAFGKPVDQPSTDADFPFLGAKALFENIQDERARELGHEFLRKDDLTRWGIYMSQMETVMNRAEADNIRQYSSSYYKSALTFYGTVTERDVLWPIPSHDISVNRKLTQNPGW